MVPKPKHPTAAAPTIPQRRASLAQQPSTVPSSLPAIQTTTKPRATTFVLPPPTQPSTSASNPQSSPQPPKSSSLLKSIGRKLSQSKTQLVRRVSIGSSSPTPRSSSDNNNNNSHPPPLATSSSSSASSLRPTTPPAIVLDPAPQLADKSNGNSATVQRTSSAPPSKQQAQAPTSSAAPSLTSPPVISTAKGLPVVVSGLRRSLRVLGRSKSEGTSSDGVQSSTRDSNDENVPPQNSNPEDGSGASQEARRPRKRRNPNRVDKEDRELPPDETAAALGWLYGRFGSNRGRNKKDDKSSTGETESTRLYWEERLGICWDGREAVRPDLPFYEPYSSNSDEVPTRIVYASTLSTFPPRPPLRTRMSASTPADQIIADYRAKHPRTPASRRSLSFSAGDGERDKFQQSFAAPFASSSSASSGDGGAPGPAAVPAAAAAASTTGSGGDEKERISGTATGTTTRKSSFRRGGGGTAHTRSTNASQGKKMKMKKYARSAASSSSSGCCEVSGSGSGSDDSTTSIEGGEDEDSDHDLLRVGGGVDQAQLHPSTNGQHPSAPVPVAVPVEVKRFQLVDEGPVPLPRALTTAATTTSKDGRAEGDVPSVVASEAKCSSPTDVSSVEEWKECE
ncbi:hypothetical protein T439DRAFT_323455 [Meredithblackwellia eburnea MCA 4105]